MPDHAKINAYDPTAVSKAAIATAWMIDTTTDHRQTNNHDAELRSIPYLTSAYAAQIRTERSQPTPPAEWRQWAAHHAYLSVQLSQAADDNAEDTATTARRTWIVTATPTGRDHWRGLPVTNSAVAVLIRTNATAPWRIDKITAGLYGSTISRAYGHGVRVTPDGAAPFRFIGTGAPNPGIGRTTGDNDGRTCPS